MRIELPSNSWADTVHRADDDANTITVASPTAGDWVEGLFTGAPGDTLRAQVPVIEPVTMTITL